VVDDQKRLWIVWLDAVFDEERSSSGTLHGD
jgi:hypothetical protein